MTHTLIRGTRSLEGQDDVLISGDTIVEVDSLNVAYSATQCALFSSIMLLLPKFIAGWSGLAVDWL